MTADRLAARIWAAAQTLNAVADTEALSGAINDLLAVANDLRAMDQPTAHIFHGLDCWCGPYLDREDPEVIIHRSPIHD